MMKSAFAFLYDAADANMIDGWQLQPDPELAARNLDKARKAIASLGPKWVLFNERATEAERDAMDAQNEMDTHSANSYTEE